MEAYPLKQVFKIDFGKDYKKDLIKDFVYPTYLSGKLMGNSIAVWDRTKYIKDMPLNELVVSG